jgi:hypothetical protein
MTGPQQRTWRIRSIISLLLGPVIWTVHLATTYVVQSTLCAFGVSAGAIAGIDPVFWTVAIATAMALAVLAASTWGLVPAMRRMQSAEERAATRFFERTALFLSLLAGIGILWSGVTVLVVHPCATLR